MSKYEPLKSFLNSRREGEIRLTFKEIESLLGFELPRSARDYRPWWANNTGTHVGVRAWRDAGWKTARVDMAGEQVTFVREASPPSHATISQFRGAPPRPASVQEAAHLFEDASIELRPSELSRSALRLIDDLAEEMGTQRAAAVALLLDQAAIERRRRLMESIAARSQPWSEDSAELIRKDRDRDGV